MYDGCIACHIGQRGDLPRSFGQEIVNGRAIAMGQHIDRVACKQEVFGNAVPHEADAYKSDRLG
jgi:hypothetical protein